MMISMDKNRAIIVENDNQVIRQVLKASLTKSFHS